MVHKLLLLTTFILLISCNENNEIQSEIPIALVDIDINLGIQPYSDLRNEGDYLYFENEGVRGIILYRAADNEFRAFEQNCSYRPLDACANVMVDPSRFFMIDTCCNSTFDFMGNPNGGPALFPLRQYATFRSGNRLIISSGM